MPSTSDRTAHDTFPPPAPRQIKVWYRDIALDARGVGNSLGNCLFIELDGPAISSFTMQLKRLSAAAVARESQLDQSCGRLAAKTPF